METRVRRAWRPAAAAALVTSLLGLVTAADAAGEDQILANGLLETDIRVGLAHDSNAFLAPDRAYYDQISGLVIEPNKQSGTYVPFRFRGEYRRGEDRRFVAYGRLGGSYYPDSATSNAEEYGAKVRLGGEWVLGRRKKRETTFYAGPVFAYDKQIYFDRDTGLQNVSRAGGNISDRYTYTSTGVEARYRNRTVGFGEFSVESSIVQRNYKEVPNVSSLDAMLFRLGGQVQFDLNDRVTLKLDYDYIRRDYDNLRARRKDAALLTSNDLLKYSYNDLGVTVRAEASRRLTFYVDYGYRIRSDVFDGYNDYTRNSFRVRTLWNGRRSHLRLAARYRDKSYDNAFIFDLPSNPLDNSPNPHKSYKTLQVDFTAERQLGTAGRLVFDYRHYNQETADPRYDYDRDRIGLSYRIEK